MANSSDDPTRSSQVDSNNGDTLGLDATKQTQVASEQGGQESHSGSLDETMPMPVEPELSASAPEDDSLAVTMPAATLPAASLPTEVDPNEQSEDESQMTPPRPPDPPVEAGGPADGSSGKGRRNSWLWISILGLLALTLIAMISAFGGYRSGIELRESAEETQIAGAVDEQFQLGLQDMEQEHYFRARQRFEYVIQLVPDYPGATDKLADVLLALNTTATPTLAPTPTLTPTPDLRSVQDMFDQAGQHLANSEWSPAIETLLMLRKTDPDLRPVEVDGMLFVALRNRGVDKITKEADLEGGIYDLTLAERFGPLDAEAQGLLNWTTLYITGASFWGIDWGQAALYFGQVAPNLPHLRDGTGWSAGERYRIALIRYGETLANQKKWCKAMEQFQIALSIAPDAEAEQALAIVAERCAAGEPGQPPDQGQPPGTGQPPGGDAAPTQSP